MMGMAPDPRLSIIQQLMQQKASLDPKQQMPMPGNPMLDVGMEPNEDLAYGSQPSQLVPGQPGTVGPQPTQPGGGEIDIMDMLFGG
jgi:hypothetical protein